MIFSSPKSRAKDLLYFLVKKKRYALDILPENTLLWIDDQCASLESIARSKSPKPELAASLDEIEKKICREFPEDYSGWGWRENTEVILVAVMLALAVRTYFIQPFKIPTGSMQPTLYGFHTDEMGSSRPPMFLWQIADFLLLGKTHHYREASSDGTVDTYSIRETNNWFYDNTTFQIGGVQHSVNATWNQIKEAHPEIAKKVFKKGQPLVNFTLTTGDHVFVNKVALHFSKAERGSVIIFTTNDIKGIVGDQARRGIPWSQYYIKRCVALGGDEIKIIPPKIFVNGDLLEGRNAFQKAYSLSDGYAGYQVQMESGSRGYFLPEIGQPYRLKDGDFCWAMGDNSPVSFDSRFWGEVPGENLVGIGLMVFWPFSERWGLIR